MTRRSIGIGIAVVLAIAVAMPAVGAPSNPLATSAGKVSKKVKKALKIGREARDTANAAQGAASNAQVAASTAQVATTAANQNANSRLRTVTQRIDDEVGTADIKDFTVDCEPGEVAVGGGALTDDSRIALSASGPSPLFDFNPTGWQAVAEDINNVVGTWQLHVQVLCARP